MGRHRSWVSGTSLCRFIHIHSFSSPSIMIQRLRLSHILLTFFLLLSITSAWPWPPSYKDIEGLILRRQDDSKNGESLSSDMAPRSVIDMPCRCVYHLVECISYENIRCSIKDDQSRFQVRLKFRLQVTQRYSSFQDSQSQWYSCSHIRSSS